MLDRELDESRDVLDLQFLHQPAAVGIDGCRRNAECRRDLGARTAFRHQLQGLALAPA